MKRLAVFILILFSSSTNAVYACSDYFPFGDGARFSIFDARSFGFYGYDPFYYSVHNFAPSFYNDPETHKPGEITIIEKPNIDLWRKRCKNVPSPTSVYDAIYGNDEVTDPQSSNSFIKYLVQHNDTEAIAYLQFAKQLSGLSDFVVDPWERNRNVYAPLRSKQVKAAIALARKTKDEDLRARYAFLAIRIAYYNIEAGQIKNIYEEFFPGRPKKNIIDYWAMYFRACTEPDIIMSNFLSAQVFAHAPDKRFMIAMHFDRKIPVEKVLALAKTREEKAAVWLLFGIRNPGRALESMQRMYTLNANQEGLDFLLLREINKLEDWIYTPYYSSFPPSVRKEGEEENYSSDFKRKKRIKSDRAYAVQVLNFVQNGKARRKANSAIWHSACAYLFLMTQNDSAALQEIASLEAMQPNKKIFEQVQVIKAMCLTSMQSDSQAVIVNEIKPLLMQQAAKGNYRFVFAIGRELEFKGNTTDAALLLSKINPEITDWNTFVYESRLAWERRKAKGTWYSYVFSEYFDYIDATYSPFQVKVLINSIEDNVLRKDSFEQWKYSRIVKDVPRLYDLLGTKYMRLNQLSLALNSFEKVNDTLWTSSHAPFAQYLDANPFFTNFYSEHKKTAADTIRFTKVTLTRTLIRYLALANDVKNPNRDYYYFLAANCYFNMTYHGNSWIMKRYWWSSTRMDVEYAGEDDFFCADLAKKYYLKAKAVAKKKTFSALCLRMAGRCEKYRLVFKLPKENEYTSDIKKWQKVFDANVYYKQIRKEYPGYYDDLISNCNSFDRYFEMRR